MILRDNTHQETAIHITIYSLQYELHRIADSLKQGSILQDVMEQLLMLEAIQRLDADVVSEQLVSHEQIMVEARQWLRSGGHS